MVASRAILSTVAVSAFVVSPVLAATINVAPGQSIQAAINSASAGDEIIVAPGTYFGSIDFAGKAITVRSANGADVTFIDGQGIADCGVVQFESAEGPGSIIEGFTIRGGVTYFIGGGGMVVLGGGAPVIRSCVFDGNVAHGDYAPGGAAFIQGSPIFESCRFEDNSSDENGGAVYVDAGEPLFVSCAFVGNAAGAHGGAIFADVGSGPNIVDCTFDENEGVLGGAVRNWTWGTTAISGSLFRGNSAANGGAVSNGLTPIVIGASEFCESVPDHISGAVQDQGNNTFRAACLCPGDLDGNDTVGWNDLNGLLVTWGNACGGCAGDLDGDGVIGFGDLLDLLVRWGACG